MIETPELLDRLENAGTYFPKIRIKAVKIEAMKQFNTEQIVGILQNWFPKKSSVDIIREIRESEEL